MKALRKFSALAIAVMLVISCFATLGISASAAAGDTVYFDNSVTNFGTVYCYMWKDNAGNNGDWPGVAMTNVSGSVWSYSVSGDFDKIIFNAGMNQTQSSDLSYPGNGKIAKPDGNYDKFQVSWSDYSGSDTPVPTSSVPSGNTATVYCKNDAGWSTVNCYMWNSENDANSTWPGASMTNLGNGYFEYKLPKNFANVIFNGGSADNKTNDMVFPGSGKIYNNSTGQWSTFDPNATEQTSPSSPDSTLPYNPGGGGGSTSGALGGYYGTNPDGKYGARKTITVDGDKSDWDSSMLIAQGVANDDPRNYAAWSMHEKGIDDYAMYAAWDNNNLYIMYEMANVQDIVAPGEPFPLTQGNLWIDNLPVFMYIYTGKGNVTHGQTADGTLWNTGTTVDEASDHVVAYSTNASNGPFIYTADKNGNLNPDVLVNKNTGINIKWGNGKTLAGTLYGIKQSGGNNGRKAGDTVSESADFVDFYQLGHKASMDMFYEISIPLKNLDITASDIENNGIGIIKISTFGTSGMDCLPYDLCMQDNAAKPYSKDASTSAEKEDNDQITVPMARIGKALSDTPVIVPTQASSDSEQTEPSQPTSPSTEDTSEPLYTLPTAPTQGSYETEPSAPTQNSSDTQSTVPPEPTQVTPSEDSQPGAATDPYNPTVDSSSTEDTAPGQSEPASQPITEPSAPTDNSSDTQATEPVPSGQSEPTDFSSQPITEPHSGDNPSDAPTDSPASDSTSPSGAQTTPTETNPAPVNTNPSTPASTAQPTSGTPVVTQPQTTQPSVPAPSVSPVTTTQSIKVEAKTKTVKYSKLKKKSRAVKAIIVKNSQASAVYQKISGSKKLKVNTGSGKITIKKGTKKGTYSIKVKVTVIDKWGHSLGSKTVKVKIKVK